MFDFDEMLFMVEAMKGVKCRPNELASVFWSWLPRSSDILDKVQPIAFINKVHNLNPSSLKLLHSQLEEFWAVSITPSTVERIREVKLDRWYVNRQPQNNRDNLSHYSRSAV